MMPLLENYTYGVATFLTLDSQPAEMVNLTRVGSQSIQSAVRWSATGLINGKHTLVNSIPVAQQGVWGLVDAITYVLVCLSLLLC